MARRQKETLRPAQEVAREASAFAAHLRAHGLSVTRQRLALFEALASSRMHPSAEELHALVRRRLPHLSLATVYKTLETLRAVGAVSDVHALQGEGRFEAALPGTGAGKPHHHLVCVGCRRICDLPEEALPELRVPAREAQGFEVQAVRAQAFGLCPACRGKDA